jgi:Ca2+-transporting ATPase
MRSPPRPRRQGLFDKAVLVRGLCQGAGLLVLLIGLYAGAPHALPDTPERDGIARALCFVALSLSNLALIQVNRSWGPGAAWAGLKPTPQIGWVSAATLAMLGIALGVPAARQLFAFEAASPALLLAALGVALASMAWFATVKQVQARRAQA